MTTNTLGNIKLKNQGIDTSQSNAARIAGFGLLIMALLAFFANSFVLENLVVPNDAAKTISNLMANEMLFRFGITGFVIVLILDVLVAWALYLFLKPASQSLSLLAATFRWVYTAIFAVSLFSLTNVLQLLNGVFTANELQSQVMMSLESFQSGWQIGLLFFGCHLLVLGYVVVKSSYVPKILGIFLLVAGFAYTLDSFAHFLLHNYADYENLFLYRLRINP
jgi:hypothetical protein